MDEETVTETACQKCGSTKLRMRTDRPANHKPVYVCCACQFETTKPRIKTATGSGQIAGPTYAKNYRWGSGKWF